MAAKDAEALRTLIAERRKEYKRLLKDPNYFDVKFNPENGGLMAKHKGHIFQKSVGAVQELCVQEIGYMAGHAVILGNESHNIFKQKSTDGTWDGKSMEIATASSGTSSNIRNSLKHCAKKPGVRVAVINILPDKYDFAAGLSKYNGLKGTAQWVDFDEVLVIHKNEIVAHYRK